MSSMFASGFGLIEAFARASEELNAFSRQIRDSMKIQADDVRTGADIRFYLDGAKLEKWVEVATGSDPEVIFCWWLEISRVGDAVSIRPHVSLSDGSLYSDGEERFAASIEEAEFALGTAVAWLRDQPAQPPLSQK